jgi:hypothetical protein
VRVVSLVHECVFVRFLRGKYRLVEGGGL